MRILRLCYLADDVYVVYLGQYDNFRSQWIECSLGDVNAINYYAALNSFNNSKQC